MDISALIQTVVAKVVALILLTFALIFPALVPHPAATAPVPAPAHSAATSTHLPTASSKAVQATTTAAKPKPAVQTNFVQKPITEPISVLQDTSVPDETLNNQTRSALVNIFCTVAGNQFKPITASGILIDSRGVILTNAHMAQFLLLRNYGGTNNIDCIVRTGSPAQPRYRATLLYLPEQWITDNASQLKVAQATGTGENDYAFLLITGTTNPSVTLPSEFPHLAMSTKTADIGQQMLLAAYPAGFLSGELINTSLYASSAFAYVTQLFSFDGGSVVDLFSIGGTVESQAGSSGGAVVRRDGTLAAIIVTATLAPGTTNQRDLRALSLAHINRSLSAAGKAGVGELLTGDLFAKAAEFNKTIAPLETKKLEDALK